MKRVRHTSMWFVSAVLLVTACKSNDESVDLPEAGAADVVVDITLDVPGQLDVASDHASDAVVDAGAGDAAPPDAGAGDADVADAANDAEVADATNDADGGAAPVCTPSTQQCSGVQPQACDAQGQWADLGAPCDTSQTCVNGWCIPTVPTSCQESGDGLDNCGPDGTESCCASPLVPGGSFYRSYDAVVFTDQSHPATVSEVRLDRFETTVGRFRKFVNAWVGGWRPAIGSGKHAHLNQGRGLAVDGGGHESGWDAAWESGIAADLDTWNANLACDSTWTATAGAHERQPVSCGTWYEMYAFCIWDGGFLPSEAEWNFAAAGGDEQRVYPWSSPATDTTIDCGHANYAGGVYPQLLCNASYATNPVGAQSPAGDGKWGHADLVGNLREWMLDVYPSPGGAYDGYSATCDDCVYQDASSGTNVIRSGDFADYAAVQYPSTRLSLPSGARFYSDPSGSRCARSP